MKGGALSVAAAGQPDDAVPSRSVSSPMTKRAHLQPDPPSRVSNDEEQDARRCLHPDGAQGRPPEPSNGARSGRVEEGTPSSLGRRVPFLRRPGGRVAIGTEVDDIFLHRRNPNGTLRRIAGAACLVSL
jgi:hypothetical protein